MELSNFILMPLLKLCVCIKLHIILDKVHKSCTISIYPVLGVKPVILFFKMQWNKCEDLKWKYSDKEHTVYLKNVYKYFEYTEKKSKQDLLFRWIFY